VCVGLVIQIAETNLTDMNGAGFVGEGGVFQPPFLSRTILFIDWITLWMGYLSCGNVLLKR